MTRFLLGMMILSLSFACQKKASEAPPPDLSAGGKFAVVAVGEAKYVIDPATESCFLVLPGGAGGSVSCNKLRWKVEKAAPHIAWLSEPRPRTEFEGLGSGPRVSPMRPSDPKLAGLMESGIREIDETHYEIDRALIDYLLENPLAGSRGARIVPSILDGKPNGFKLYAIRPTSIFAHLGLDNGDTVHAINGHVLSSPDKALEVYSSIKDETKFRIELSRRGRPLSLFWKIQ